MAAERVGRWFYETVVTSLGPILLFAGLVIWALWRESTTSAGPGAGGSAAFVIVVVAGFLATGWSTASALEARIPLRVAGREAGLRHRDVRRLMAPRRQVFSRAPGGDLRDAVVGLASLRHERPVLEVGPALWKRMKSDPWPQRFADVQDRVARDLRHVAWVAAVVLGGLALATAGALVAWYRGAIGVSPPWAVTLLVVVAVWVMAVGTWALIRQHAIRCRPHRASCSIWNAKNLVPKVRHQAALGWRVANDRIRTLY